MKKLLILGATGMAGHMLYNHFKSNRKYEVYNTCFREKADESSIILNIRDEKAVKEIIKRVNPDYVINCVGILIKGSKQSVENCVYVNSYFPHFVSRIIKENNSDAKFIHISTDCVFSGSKGMYKDTDIKDALDTYGMSKNLGEVINETDLTVRTSIIGPELKKDGEGLFHWLCIQPRKSHINGYTKTIWGGVTTLELAKAVDALLENNITGLYQLSNSTPINKYDLLALINTTFDLGITIEKVDGPDVNKSILNTQLDNFMYTVPGYDEMINELFTYMTKNNSLYEQYLRKK